MSETRIGHGRPDVPAPQRTEYWESRYPQQPGHPAGFLGNARGPLIARIAASVGPVEARWPIGTARFDDDELAAMGFVSLWRA